jgi:hypothetical protein
MCKRHWKAVHFPSDAQNKEKQPPPPEGESVYDSILPASISFRPAGNTAAIVATDDKSETPVPEGVTLMPLVAFLREGSEKPAGWHREAERRARGFFPVASISSQLEPWERQLARKELV